MLNKITICTAARRLLGVPYRHQGRGPEGLDCLGLLLCVAAELDLRDGQGMPLIAYDRRDYGWRPDGAAFEADLAAQLRRGDAPEPGDILLFRLMNNPQHVAIFSALPDGRPGLIHAYAPAGRVVEHGFDGPWPKRLHAVFCLAMPNDSLPRERGQGGVGVLTAGPDNS